MRVKKIFFVMRQTPFRHDRTAARDDAGHAFRGQRNVTQQHAGVDREIIDALLGLFDQRVAENFPRQIFGFAIDFFERLINRHGADRHGRIANNPFARFVNIFAGRQIHHRVGAPADAPRIFSTSSSIEEPSAELPILALIFTRKLRPIIIGSNSG